MATKNFDFDLIVIGSGAAGSAAAFAAASAGLRVAVAESGTWGGCGVNFRDLPFRAASSFSHNYKNALHASRFGISSSNLRFNYPSVLNWQKLAERRAASGIKQSFEEAGITCLNGLAHFLSFGVKKQGNCHCICILAQLTADQLGAAQHVGPLVVAAALHIAAHHSSASCSTYPGLE